MGVKFGGSTLGGEARGLVWLARIRLWQNSGFSLSACGNTVDANKMRPERLLQWLSSRDGNIGGVERKRKQNKNKNNYIIIIIIITIIIHDLCLAL